MMVAAPAGDRSAYRLLLDDLRGWLAHYYRRLPVEILDDAVQDALMAVHAKRHTYDASNMTMTIVERRDRMIDALVAGLAPV